ncbi:Cation transport protein [Halolamina pelagica]|uniref:Cation transport protein n=1 Tax=Halolamina pelagica TaxID=699431 RepID=A0A1I5TRB9_9EURY|nr:MULTISPECIES: potassium transporter TrkG [Halolamina]SFP84886.1 Cation transport protein [Halolamina pelagica]
MERPTRSTGVREPAQTATLAAFTEPLNALFESVSGFTGTGLTMTDNEEVLPRTLQWWRTFSEWVGGVGVIVLTTAIIVVLWTTFLVVGTFVLLLALPAGEYSLANVLFEVASAQGNVGLSSRITGPDSLPTVGKIAFLFHMWIGRLEIIPVLVMLRTIFKRGGLYR